MRGRALPLIFALLLSGTAQAQVTWQPAQPPLVTAENETWFRAGQSIEWNGDFYYPTGTPEAFNRYQMVRAGSYRGIPLYTDTTLEPYSIVFVPIAGGRMQPYERPRTGTLAGTTGSRTSSFPTAPASEQVGAPPVSTEGIVTQAPAPPTFARAYDLGPAPVGEPRTAIATQPSPLPAPVAAAPAPAGTSGRTAPRAVGTSGRTAVSNHASSAVRPVGINGVWLNYDGRRWVSAGKAVDLASGDFAQVGDYRGFPVYQRRGDSLTIYVPSAGDLVVPYKPRGL